MVWPTIWGKTVEARDHVLTTRFSPSLFMSSIFLSSLGLTYGPFFNDLATLSLPFGYQSLITDQRRFLLRRRTIHLPVSLRLRVFLPMVGLPQGDLGEGMPIGVRPSPPPWG
jgi:hypothetical protein